jgi:hypothetical protein
MTQPILRDRILKGIEHFDSIQPSTWNVVHTTHVKVLLRLTKEYIEGTEVFINDLEDSKRGAKELNQEPA